MTLASSGGKDFAMLCTKHLTVDFAAHRVELDGEPVPLTRSEFELLRVLASRPGVVMSNREILQAMWGAQWHADTTPLQVHVSRLRRKLGESGAAPRHIVTIHGVGYRFDADPTGELTDAMAARSHTPRGRMQCDVLPVTALISLERRILWAGGGVEAILGCTPEDLVGLHVGAIVHRDDTLKVHEWQELMSGRAVTRASRLRGADDMYVPTRGVVRPVIDHSGAVSSLLSVWHPSLKAAEPVDLEPIVLAERRSGGSRTRRIVLVFDEDSIVRGISPSRGLLGWSPRDLVGRACIPVAPTFGDARAAILRLIASGVDEVTGVFRVPAKDGTVIPLQGTLHFHRADGGGFICGTVTLEVPDDRRGRRADGLGGGPR